MLSANMLIAIGQPESKTDQTKPPQQAVILLRRFH